MSLAEGLGLGLRLLFRLTSLDRLLLDRREAKNKKSRRHASAS
jgi:hypothetical protein